MTEEVGFSADELAALAGGQPPELVLPEGADVAAGNAALRARGAVDDADRLHVSVAPVREVLARPGLLAQVDVEVDGLVRRSWLLATPTLGLAVRTLHDGRFGLRAFATRDFLVVLHDLVRLADRPDVEGRFTTTAAQLALAVRAGRVDEATQRLLTARGRSTAATAAFLPALLHRLRAVDVVLRHAVSPTRQVGCDLTWVDGGEHGLWVVPPFGDGQVDATEFDVHATSRGDLLKELAEALPGRQAAE